MGSAVASYALFLIVLLRLIIDGRWPSLGVVARRAMVLLGTAVLLVPVVEYASIVPVIVTLVLVMVTDAAFLLSVKKLTLARTVAISIVPVVTLVLLRDARIVGGVSPLVESVRAFAGAGQRDAAVASEISAGGLFHFAAGALIAGFEANHPVAYVLEKLKLGPAAPYDQHQRFASKDVGRAIGILERLIVFALVVTGNMMAVMFVMTAKAFTRFRELDSREFAEYVLIGTLMSVGLAALVGAVFGFLL